MKPFRILFLLFFVIAAVSCDEDEPKSSEKTILSFKFSSFSPQIEGTIDESAKSIALTVPNGTAVTALVPVIVTSPKAVVSPASGTAANFSSPVTYTVTAEDGSTVTYQVTVTVLKSSEKKILSFNLSEPPVTGTINESGKTVTLLIPNALEKTALAPVVQVSQMATVQPASGAVVDFTNPVTFKVTAEDGTQQDYVVSAVSNSVVNFSIDPYIGLRILEPGAYFLLKGNNFGTDASKIKVVWKNTMSQATIEFSNFVVVNNTSIGFLLPESMPLGNYEVTIFINYEKIQMTDIFTVAPPSPQITSIDKTTVERGQNIKITGKHFQVTGNTVRLSKGNTFYALTVVSESATEIEATVPNTIPVDVYTLSIIVDSQNVFYNAQDVTIVLPATTPVITNIDKGSYFVGETMIITGSNLKKQGVATNINFLPFLGGTTIVRSAVANAEGTQVTFAIPNDFPKGTYAIVIEVDFEFSEEYTEIIQIK